LSEEESSDEEFEEGMERSKSSEPVTKAGLGRRTVSGRNVAHIDKTLTARIQRLLAIFRASRTGIGGQRAWKRPVTAVMLQLLQEYQEMRKRDAGPSRYLAVMRMM
jgi:hypothetical protein